MEPWSREVPPHPQNGCEPPAQLLRRTPPPLVHTCWLQQLCGGRGGAPSSPRALSHQPRSPPLRKGGSALPVGAPSALCSVSAVGTEPCRPQPTARQGLLHPDTPPCASCWAFRSFRPPELWKPQREVHGGRCVGCSCFVSEQTGECCLAL